MEFTYKRADELDFDPRPQIAMVFSEGFYRWLQELSKDKACLARAFAHIFDLSQFFVAVHGDEIASIVGCCTAGTKPVSFDKQILCKEFGFLRGRIAKIMLTKYLLQNVYPFPLGAETGSIEIVASSPKYHRTGSAFGLINYVMETLPYRDYVLEVVDNNTGAIALYEKLGFREIQRTPEKHAKRAGFDYRIYMKHSADGKEAD